jgi:uncharacterized cupin superfamily protein
MDEAPLERVGGGLAPAGDGWFVVNARDATWLRRDGFGVQCVFETNGAVARGRPGVEERPFEQLGIRLHQVEPGQPSTLYHEEPGNEEAFLVLSGECRAVIEGVERRLRQWDFVYCPPGTKHSFVGAGDGPCLLLKLGARVSGDVRYHPTPLAVSVPEPTDSPAEAYAPYGHWQPDGESPL